MPDANKTKVITLICERSVDLSNQLENQTLKDDPNVEIVKYPCSGMIQPLMIEAAMKAGASGVIVCGCQIGDCYYREGNRMIRERLLGERPPGLKKTVDRRRVIGLWLSRPQTGRFISEAKEFVAFVGKLNSEEGPPKVEPPKPAPAAKPPVEAAKPAEAAPKPEPATEKPVKEQPKPAEDKAEAEPAKPATEEPKPAAEAKQKPAKAETKKAASSADKLAKEARKKTDELAKSEDKEKPADSPQESTDKS